MIVSSSLITDLWKFMFSTIQSRGAWKSSLCFKRLELGILFRWLCRHSLIHNSGFPSAWFLTQLLFRSNLWPVRVDFGSKIKKSELRKKEKIAEKRHFFTKTWMLVVWSSIITNILYHICVMIMLMMIITISTLMPLTHSPWASLASRLLIQYSSSSTRRHRWQHVICENQPVINEIHHRYQNPVSHLYTQTNCCQPFLTG